VVSDSARAVFDGVQIAILARSNEFSFSFLLADPDARSGVGAGRGPAPAHHGCAGGLCTRTQRRNQHRGGVFFRQSNTRSDVFARADLAVESARQSSRNGFVVLPDTHTEKATLGSFGWRTLIESALVESRWRLLRQPVVRLLAAKEVIHSECMARLVDGQGELVPASSFMPMAARHRLMTDVDRAMVTLALQQVHDEAHANSVLAINLSPQSIGDSAFVEWLSQQLVSLAGAASRVALEVSEFGALRNTVALMRVREMARARCVAFGIDHFGLDPQAVQLLRDAAPDYVKLSGALTQELVAPSANIDLLVSFVKLAHTLDVTVIAQQIESPQQVEVLLAAGVGRRAGLLLWGTRINDTRKRHQMGRRRPGGEPGAGAGRAGARGCAGCGPRRPHRLQRPLRPPLPHWCR
jgi:EAL domain-containing protein (putative c-di-GMP-specific phosphodiesterase class I)